MALTGIQVLALVGLAAAGAAGATVVGWSRFGRLRIPVRVVGVLLTQVLVLSAAGLAVNRSEQFYSSWNDLLQPDAADGRHRASAPGRLDQWVRQHDADGGTQPLAFPWHPAGWTAWHLAAPPTVTIPADYLRHRGWRYPAVLVLSGGQDGWDDGTEAAAASSAEAAGGPAVLVFARTTPAASAPALAVALPDQLDRDLRVFGHSWALVSTASQAPLARQVVLAAPGRYPALAVVPIGPAGARAAPPAPPRTLPVGEAVMLLGISASAAGGARAGGVPRAGSSVPSAGPPGADELRMALLWALRQTPAPLAAAAPLARPPQAPPSPPRESPVPLRPHINAAPRTG